MDAIYILIGISLVVATGFLIAFLWSVKDGQYKDDYTPGMRILFEDPVEDTVSATAKNSQNEPD